VEIFIPSLENDLYLLGEAFLKKEKDGMKSIFYKIRPSLLTAGLTERDFSALKLEKDYSISASDKQFSWK
jgi:hypothetical protein